MGESVCSSIESLRSRRRRDHNSLRVVSGLALHFISQTKVGVGTGTSAQTGKTLWPRLGWHGSMPRDEWGYAGQVSHGQQPRS